MFGGEDKFLNGTIFSHTVLRDTKLRTGEGPMLKCACLRTSSSTTWLFLGINNTLFIKI